MTHPRMTVPRLLALAVLAAGLACGGGGDPLQGLLDDIVEAAEDRDADAIVELLAADFRGSDGTDREGAVRLAKQYFMGYDSLDVDLSNVELNRAGPTGRARFRLKASGVPTNFHGLGDLVPRSATYDFDVQAREVDGRWKLVGATWSEPVAEEP